MKMSRTIGSVSEIPEAVLDMKIGRLSGGDYVANFGIKDYMQHAITTFGFLVEANEMVDIAEFMGRITGYTSDPKAESLINEVKREYQLEL